MAPAFRFDKPPFDGLTPAQQALVRETSDVASFAKDAVILTPQDEPTHVYVLIDGHVQLVEGGEVTAVFGPDELFALRALVAARASGTLVAMDAVSVWRIPKATVQALIAANAEFSALVFGDVSRRLSTLAQRHEQREFLSLMMARVKDAFVRKPFFVDGALDLVSVCRLLAQHGQTNALVRDGERLGMFTTTDLRDALLRAQPPSALPVREVARFDLISVAADGDLFEAQLLMLRHRIHRVLVRDGEEVVGVLSQLDLMGFVSNHSHIVALQIEQAASVAELKQAALQMDGLIALLHSGGIKVDVISRLVRELNSQVFARLWGLLAPAALVADSCLIVMGSEGRGEQILKTDQDNALLLRDGASSAGLEQAAERFTAALIDFGYPRCPGGIMLSNPLWRQPLAGFRQTLRDWMFGSDAQGPMNLAIFLDAVAVAGDAGLLRQARQFVDDFLPDNDAFLARFASAADQFSESPGWWARLTGLRTRDDEVIDLKKIGTFPIVHGVRSLALQQRIDAISTRERLQALVERERLPAELARDLLDALHVLMALKLKHNLRQRQVGEPVDNLVQLSALGLLEREQLKDALGIIKQFRRFLRRHFALDAL